MDISFEMASFRHEKIIFSWLAEPHMIEFWDNSQEHKDDILNFINKRKQSYFYGTTNYWVGSVGNWPYCFLLSDILLMDQDLSDLHREFMSKSGHTINLDFGIGSKMHIGKGLAAPTLREFIKFYQEQVDPKADTFFLDPGEDNSRAQHVYRKAGFEQVGTFSPHAGALKECSNYLMVKKTDNLKQNPTGPTTTTF